MDPHQTLFIRYVDLNNNVYTVNNNQINYMPIAMELSSTGDYDGGEEKTSEINQEEITGLLQIIDIILRTHDIHIDHRDRMSVLLSLKVRDIERRLIVSKSKEQFALEAYLKQMLKS